MLEQGISALLNADATLSSLLTSGGDKHLYAVRIPTGVLIPEGEAPTRNCLSYQIVSGSSEYTLDLKAERMKRLQLDAWSNVYGQTKGIIRAACNVIDGYVGTLPDADQTRVKSILRGVEMDQFESDARVFRSTVEFEVTYTE